MKTMKRDGDRAAYHLVAPVYEWIEACYSGGAISACKRAQTAYFREGEHVLFAGAGTAPEALLAAQAGARVTLLDRSEAMLAMARTHFRKAGFPDPFCWHGDLASYAPGVTHDVVVANFFLNVFLKDELAPVLAQLNALRKPGGRLLIGDFAPFRGSGPCLWLQKLYWFWPLLIANQITGEPIHPIYTYQPALEQAGLTVQACFYFRPLGFGPAWYQLLIAV